MLLESVKMLSHLPNLSSLQIRRNPTPGVDPNSGLPEGLKDEEFMHHLGQLPMLQTIYVIQPYQRLVYWIWNRCDTEWQGQVVSEWTAWGLMNGEV
jgi:hypothetical protein